MKIDFLFLLNSVLFGVGLAMDAFSVSLANGLHEPDMKPAKENSIAGTFAFFQFIMPLIGWICVRTAVQKFKSFQKFIPWIALILLVYIGGKMIIEGVREKRENESSDEADAPAFAPAKKLAVGELIVQGIATSIDALSVGFTIAEYDFVGAFIEALIIAAVTYIICIAGVRLGKKFGVRLAGKAGILGGIILIAIGIEIFIT